MAAIPQLTTLQNGLRVLTTSLPTAQAASIAFFAGIGSRGESARTNGLSHYLEHMLFKGTEQRPSAQLISQAIEGAGGTLNAYTTHELTCYWNNVPYEAAGTGIAVVADMIQRSLLAQEEIDRERTVVQQEIRRGHDTPASRVGELISRATFGDQPIGWPVAGTIETVEGMHRPDFTEHMQRFYTSTNAVFSVAGNVTHEDVVRLAEQHFGELPTSTPDRSPAANWGLPPECVIVEERETEQTQLALSMQALARRDPDRYALEILHTILGRGMSSRLFEEVRERRGLAYSVGSRITRYQDIGSFTVAAGVTRAQQEEALQVIVEQLHRIAEEPVEEEELRRAIDYAAGSFRLSFETPMSYGQRFGEQLLQDGEIESIDETVARLRAVTAEDVRRAGQRVIARREFSLAVVGPSAGADRLAEILAA
ncbi:MAG: M16 family metallopeptidase [Dehalococcoidia bacterium]